MGGLKKRPGFKSTAGPGCLLSRKKMNPEQDTKQCPFCAETIKRQAVICRFCGYDLHTGAPAHNSPQYSPARPEIKAHSSVMDGVKIGFGIFFVLPLLLLVGLLAFCSVLLPFTGGKTNSSVEPSIKERRVPTASKMHLSMAKFYLKWANKAASETLRLKNRASAVRHLHRIPPSALEYKEAQELLVNAEERLK